MVKDEQLRKNMFDTCAELMMVINRCPVPVIAAVDGLAAAAGCQLVAACDIAVCTERSSFSTPGYFAKTHLLYDKTYHFNFILLYIALF